MRAAASTSDAPSRLSLAVAIPAAACLYSTVISPLIVYSSPDTNLQQAEPGITNRIFWPLLFSSALVFVLAKRKRLDVRTQALHLKFLFAYTLLAGTSVLWAYSPAASATRFSQQFMVLFALIAPAMVAPERTDFLKIGFACFAFGTVLNFIFCFFNPIESVLIVNGYSGYLLGKNYLGEFAAAAFILGMYQITKPGVLRYMAIPVSALAITLLIWANSKTALGLAFCAPALALIVLFFAHLLRLSPAILLVGFPVAYNIMYYAVGFTMSKLSYMIYGDSTFTGRTIIWDFASQMIATRPLLGWGYQSFWLVGSGAPSVTLAPGFVKVMPNAHNGYYDTTLELGAVGYYLLLAFLFSCLHSLKRVLAQSFVKAWALLSIMLYVICYNYLESLWMRGFEFLWILFVIAIVEAARLQKYVGGRPAISKVYVRRFRRLRGCPAERPASPLSLPTTGHAAGRHRGVPDHRTKGYPAERR